MTPEQEVVADQLEAIARVVRSARETVPMVGAMPNDDAEFGRSLGR